MRISITIEKGDTVSVSEDWGYPEGIKVGDVVIHLSSEGIQKVSAALFALETDRAMFNLKKYDEGAVDYHATEGADRMNWWDNPDTVHSVASLAVYESELSTADDVLSFFEKPWKFDELYENYDNWVCVQGELQDERRATL